jgi:hypothetical protein
VPFGQLEQLRDQVVSWWKCNDRRALSFPWLDQAESAWPRSRRIRFGVLAPGQFRPHPSPAATRICQPASRLWKSKMNQRNQNNQNLSWKSTHREATVVYLE